MSEQAFELSIEELVGRFPKFQVAFALVLGMRQTDAPGIEALLREAEKQGQVALAGREIAELEEIKDWRAAYRDFGCKKTSYRNSSEALLRRLRGEAGLPSVLPLVDLYNALSVKYLVPAGADDLAKLSPPLTFRFSRIDDSFIDLAKDPPENDPPANGEVIYADAEKTLCRRWNWRQDARSRIRPETADAAVVIQTLAPDGAERLEAAAHELAALASDDLGATCRWAIASAERPRVSVTA